MFANTWCWAESGAAGDPVHCGGNVNRCSFCFFVFQCWLILFLATRSQFPDHPGPWQWKRQVLTPGRPGNSPIGAVLRRAMPIKIETSHTLWPRESQIQDLPYRISPTCATRSIHRVIHCNITCNHKKYWKKLKRPSWGTRLNTLYYFHTVQYHVIYQDMTWKVSKIKKNKARSKTSWIIVKANVVLSRSLQTAHIALAKPSKTNTGLDGLKGIHIFSLYIIFQRKHSRWGMVSSSFLSHVTK